MSGAAGLAAAKRRRSAVPPSPSTARTNRSSAPPKPSPSSEKEPVVSAPTETKITPLQVLNQHEVRIKELEENKDSSVQAELLNKEINELKQTILKMQTFAIETSLELTKLKKNMTSEVSTDQG